MHSLLAQKSTTVKTLLFYYFALQYSEEFYYLTTRSVMEIVSGFLIFYGVLALSHIGIQLFLGHLEHRKQITHHRQRNNNTPLPKISLIIPSYNEDSKILLQSIMSCRNQDYPDLEVFVVDDGSKDIARLEKTVYRQFEDDPIVTIIRSQKNVGKRHAQHLAFEHATGEIIVTIDSDTLLHDTQALQKIIRRFNDSPKIGAITGDVQVENHSVNILTRLIGYRYWTAFHQERAAQSYFNVLMCCSGPFSAYRRDIIERVKDRYISQQFLGKTCTYGDDRHLTNLVLEEGYSVVFDGQVKVHTYVPEVIDGYIKQQIRWNKSFYREMLWTLKSIRKHHWYMIYDLCMQLILPFLLIVALIAMVYQTISTGDIYHLYKYIAILAGIAIVRALYGIYRTKNIGFLLFVIYGFMHVLLLLPTRLYALATLNEVKWGTR